MSVRRIIKRAWDDANEITGLFESAAPDPLFFLSPNVVRSDLARESYTDLMRPTKRRRITRMPVRKRRTVRRRFKRRARGSWKRRSMMKTGRPLGKATPCKARFTAETSDFVLPDSRITFWNLCALGAQGTLRNNRISDEVNIRGFKMNLYARAGKANEPNMLNIAVVSPNSPKALTDDGLINTDDWFRGYRSERGVAFNAANTLTRAIGEINTDRWNVHWRKRFVLHRNGRDREWRLIKKYLKIGREYGFEDQTATLPNGNNLFLVMWPQDMDGASEPSQNNLVTIQLRGITIFKET